MKPFLHEKFFRCLILITATFIMNYLNSHAQQITHSGITVDNFGNKILITQGVSGSILIAGKQCLIRVFVNAADLPKASKVNFTIGGFAQSEFMEINKSDLIIESAAPNGPSVGFIVPGIKYPKGGDYGFNLSVSSDNGNILKNIVVGNINFQPAVDLRLLVFYLYGADWYWPTPAYTEDAKKSMLRLGSMLPVRDGVQENLNTDKCSGIRYVIGNPMEAYGKGCLHNDVCGWDQTRQINSTAGDHIDITIEFRPGLFNPEWNPPGDPEPGGNSGRPAFPYDDLPRASCVVGFWNGMDLTADCFAEEIGHNFGLVPSASPHNDGGSHSKDQFINDPYAFDFINRRIFVTVNDAMGSLADDEAVMFSAYDWNFLQKEMVAQLQSTGTETNVCAPVPQPANLSYWSKFFLGNFNGIAGISASYNMDDDYMLALVAEEDGEVYELFYKDYSNSFGKSIIGYYHEGIIDVTGFYNKDDQYRVAIVATNDGNLHEIFYSPSKGKGESIIGHFDNIVSISGFFADNDEYRIIIVATSDGNIHELFYHPVKGRGESVIAHYDEIVDVSANYGSSFHPDDRSVIVTTSNGTAYQVLYNSSRKMVKQPFFRGQPGVQVAANAGATFTIGPSGEFDIIYSNYIITEQIISEGMQHITDLSVDYLNGRNLICSTSDGNVYRLNRLIR